MLKLKTSLNMEYMKSNFCYICHVIDLQINSNDLNGKDNMGKYLTTSYLERKLYANQWYQ